MRSFNLSILALDRPFYKGECTSLIVPTTDGLYGIEAGHTNLISAIVTGAMTYVDGEGNRNTVAVSNGLVKVENNTVLVLVETAERPEEIDENRAKRAAAEAKEAILQKMSIREYTIATQKISRELNRLKIKKSKYYL